MSRVRVKRFLLCRWNYLEDEEVSEELLMCRVRIRMILLDTRVFAG